MSPIHQRTVQFPLNLRNKCKYEHATKVLAKTVDLFHSEGQITYRLQLWPYFVDPIRCGDLFALDSQSVLMNFILISELLTKI